ncbi:MAG: flagellar hook-associated protein FlgK, partial [Opitutales bacterium]|nr:flagellar hook-associated protein FlgK [Opitutales bacterium]
EFTGLGERSFSSYYRATVSDLAQNVATVESRLEDEGIVFNLLKEQQDSVSGVSIDEEMTDMMKFQRAFEATARHIKAIDEMLDVIINRLI